MRGEQGRARDNRRENESGWKEKNQGNGFKNATTYFFARFPGEHMEKDLCSIFQLFGRVAEVFIAKWRNKWERRLVCEIP